MMVAFCGCHVAKPPRFRPYGSIKEVFRDVPWLFHGFMSFLWFMLKPFKQFSNQAWAETNGNDNRISQQRTVVKNSRRSYYLLGLRVGRNGVMDWAGCEFFSRDILPIKLDGWCCIGCRDTAISQGTKSHSKVRCSSWKKSCCKRM